MNFTADIDPPDPATDDRPPSEIYLLLDDQLEPRGLYSPVQRNVSEKACKDKASVIESYRLDNSLEYVLLIYAMVHKGVLDIPAIDEDEYNFKTSQENIFGFKGIAFSCRISKSRLRPYDLEEVAENLTKKDKNGKGPYMVPDKEDGKYRLIGEVWTEPLAFSFIVHSTSYAMYVCDFDKLFKYIRTEDMPEDKQGPITIAVREYDFGPLAERMTNEIIDGNVNDFVSCKLFRSKQFTNDFFRSVKKKEKLTELFLAVDKISKPKKPKTMIYFCITQPIPNMELLMTLLEEIKHSSVSKENLEIQLRMTLEAACRWGHFDAFDFLLQHVGSVSFECLRKAIFGGNPDIVDCIIRKESWTQDHLKKALEWSCFCGEQSIFRSLRQMDAECTDRCFYEAACGGNFNMFLDFCREGFDLELKFTDNRTLLHAAAEHGNESILEFLLQRGLEVNVCSSSGVIPLQLAVQNGHTDVAEVLLQSGSEFNVKDANGISPLHMVCMSGNLSLLERLLNLGADVKVQDNRGRSILHKAAFGGSLEVIGHLPATLDIEAKDKYGNTVVHFAAIQGHLHVVAHFVDLKPQLLSEKNNCNWNLILCAAYGGHDKLFDFLLQNGVDALAVTYDGQNAKVLAEQGKKLKKLSGKNFEEQFGETIVFGSVKNFDIIIERLSEYLK